MDPPTIELALTRLEAWRLLHAHLPDPDRAPFLAWFLARSLQPPVLRTESAFYFRPPIHPETSHALRRSLSGHGESVELLLRLVDVT